MNRFKDSKFEFAAQVSAVAVKAGASGNAKYTDGVMVFTMQKGGLMYETQLVARSLNSIKNNNCFAFIQE